MEEELDIHEAMPKEFMVSDFHGHLAPLLYWTEHGGGEGLVPKH